jgi:hypothetical protein
MKFKLCIPLILYFLLTFNTFSQNYSNDEFEKTLNENRNHKYSNPKLEEIVNKLRKDDNESNQIYKPLKSKRMDINDYLSHKEGYQAHSFSVPIDSIYRKTSDGSYVPKYDSYKGTTGIGNIQERQFFIIILTASISFLVLIVFLVFYVKKKKNHVDFKEKKKN